MAKSTNKNPMQHFLNMAGDFVAEQKGKWEHKDWEAFLEQVQKAGWELSDELKKNLGNILEATKQFYIGVSKIPNKKPVGKSKPRAKAKSKSKAKAKA